MARVPSCVEVAELVTAYLDGALPRRTRARVTRHLARCEDCTRLVAQVRDLVARLAVLDAEPLRASTRRTLLTAFRVTNRRLR